MRIVATAMGLLFLGTSMFAYAERPADATLTVRVLDYDAREPIPYASVSCGGWGGNEEANTNKRGEVVLRVAPDSGGKIYCEARAHGFEGPYGERFVDKYVNVRGGEHETVQMWLRRKETRRR